MGVSWIENVDVPPRGGSTGYAQPGYMRGPLLRDSISSPEHGRGVRASLQRPHMSATPNIHNSALHAE